jgi:hypothetical protein
VWTLAQVVHVLQTEDEEGTPHLMPWTESKDITPGFWLWSQATHWMLRAIHVPSIPTRPLLALLARMHVHMHTPLKNGDKTPWVDVWTLARARIQDHPTYDERQEWVTRWKRFLPLCDWLMKRMMH